MTEVIAFFRFSTPEQEDGDSLERQERDVETFCARQGWTIVDRVRDLGRSAWKGDHLSKGNLGKLTARIEAGLIPKGTILVAEKFDRFARMRRHVTQDWVRRITAQGVKIAMADTGRIWTDNPSLFEDMELLWQAETSFAYSDNISTRVLSARKAALERAEKREAGTRWVLNRRVAGWLTVRPTWDGFDVDEARAQLVRDVYQLSADGVGAPSIARRLNDRPDCPSWGRWRKIAEPKWDTTSIRALLKNPAVEGDYIVGAMNERKGTEYKLPRTIHGYFPRIVDADLVERARAGVQARKAAVPPRRPRRAEQAASPPPKNSSKPKRSNGVANLFAGLLRCSECGGVAHVGWSGNGRSVNKHAICDAAVKSRGCTNKAVFHYSQFERAAVNTILHLALDNRFFENTDDLARLRIQIAEARKRVGDLRARRRNWMERFDSPDDRNDPDIQDHIRRLGSDIKAKNAEISNLEVEITKASGAASDIEYLKRVKDIVDAMESEDDDERDQARRRVQAAFKTIVMCVELDRADTYCVPPQRTMTLILQGGGMAMKFDNDGQLLEAVDGNAQAIGNDVFGTVGDGSRASIEGVSPVLLQRIRDAAE